MALSEKPPPMLAKTQIIRPNIIALKLIPKVSNIEESWGLPIATQIAGKIVNIAHIWRRIKNGCVNCSVVPNAVDSPSTVSFVAMEAVHAKIPIINHSKVGQIRPANLVPLIGNMPIIIQELSISKDNLLLNA